MREVTVQSKPVPQGGMKAFAVKGRAFTTQTNAGPLQRYRNDIRNAWEQKYEGREPYHGPLEVYISFTFARPKSHYNASGKVKTKDKYKHAPGDWVTKKPDIDKVTRAVLDSLTALAYDDDAQVVVLNAAKRYGEDDMTSIKVFEMTLQTDG